MKKRPQLSEKNFNDYVSSVIFGQYDKIKDCIRLFLLFFLSNFKMLCNLSQPGVDLSPNANLLISFFVALKSLAKGAKVGRWAQNSYEISP